MKPAKLLHLLLAALLCYGQLAASYHVAGHFYSHTETNARSSHSGNHHTHNHDHGFADPRLTAHPHNSPGFAAASVNEGPVNNSDSVELDCELFHALASLSVIFPPESYKPITSSLPASGVSYTSTHITSLVLETKRIRGPPVLS